MFCGLPSPLLYVCSAAVARYANGAGPMLTKHAEKIYEAQRAVSKHYEATSSSTNVYIVKGREHRHRVDLLQKSCQCSFWTQYGIPCRHAICAADSDGRLANYPQFVEYAFHSMYLMANYVDTLKDTICEVVDLDALVPDGKTQPNINVKQAGRPKKKRVRSRGELVGGTQHKRTKCGSCNQPGHNARTCTNKQFGTLS